MEVFFQQIAQDTKGEWEKKLERNIKKRRIALPRGYSRDNISERWKEFHKHASGTPEQKSKIQKELLSNRALLRSDLYTNNIENYMGLVEVPTSVVGPLVVAAFSSPNLSPGTPSSSPNGGDAPEGLPKLKKYFVPIASYDPRLAARLDLGMRCVNSSGGVSACVVMEGVSRDPLFIFASLLDAGKFVVWCRQEFAQLKSIAEATTRHGKLAHLDHIVDGNIVHMKCQFTVGDASGQNMVTIATQEIVKYIEEKCPMKPTFSILEGGLSSDKKGCHRHMSGVRGKRVTCEATISKDSLMKYYSVTPEQVNEAWELFARGIRWSGSVGFNCIFASVFTGLATALGQDPACVSEAHIGTTRTVVTKEGDLYLSIVAPNLIVGSVGGGTKLPPQRACMEIMGCAGIGKANELAEVMAGSMLCGELAFLAEMARDEGGEIPTTLSDTAPKMDFDLSDETTWGGKDLEQIFNAAREELSKLKGVGTDTLAKLYGLMRQCKNGDWKKKGGLNLFSSFASAAEKAKIECWKANKGMTADQAKREYCRVVGALLKKRSTN